MIKQLLSKTPRIGKHIRNIGGALLGLNLAATTLPEVPDSWMMLANIILAIVMVIYGQKQTPEQVKAEADLD